MEKSLLEHCVLPNSALLERHLSTGVRVCVQNLSVLRIEGDTGWSFIAPLSAVHAVLSPCAGAPACWTLYLGYRVANVSFECTTADIPALRHVLADTSFVDMSRDRR